MLDGRRSGGEQLLVWPFVVLPLIALVAAVPLGWGWGLSWTDVGLTVAFYFASGLGVTIGFHRHFTHRAFKATPALRVALVVAGSMAFQGSITTWVASRRRHHAYADKDDDPHSPWLFGTGPVAVARGLAGSRTWAGCSTATRPTPPGSRRTYSQIPASAGLTASSSAGRSSAWPRPPFSAA